MEIRPCLFQRLRVVSEISFSPVSLQKMLVEEHAGSVLYRSEYNPYFHTDSKLFPATEFLVEVLQHLPDAGTHLIRRYGLYSSRSRGTWSRTPHLARLAPEGWQKDHQGQPALHLSTLSQDTMDQSVSAKEARSAWARLLAKIYEVDPLRCTRCGSQMRVLAVITDPQQVLRILRHLIKTGAAPPGLDAASLC